MRPRIPVIVFSCTSLLASACKKEPPPPPPKDDPSLLRIAVTPEGISVAGEPVSGVVLEDRDQLIHPLLDRLEARHKQLDGGAWGKVEITFAPGTTCHAAMSVLTSTLIAETTHFTLRSGDVAVGIPAMQIRPIPEGDPADQPMRPLTLGVHPDGSVDVFSAPCLEPFDTTTPEGLPALVKVWCADAGDCVRETRVECDEKTPIDKVLPALAAVRANARWMEIGPPPSCDQPLPDRQPGAPELTPRMLARGLMPRTPQKNPRYKVTLDPIPGVDAARAEAVTAAVRARLDNVRTCYELGLVNNPNLQGIVPVRLEINKKGGVFRARNKAGNDDMPDAFVARCSAAALSNAVFPTSDARTSVDLLLRFKPPPW